jgi:UDP-glucuronate decarboxylase
MERRRILVLGAASVLGAHLCERLLAEGHEVIAVDDFTSGSFATIAHLKRKPRFAFVEHDITTKFDAKVDVVFHLAVPSSERSCAADPMRAALIGVMGTANALEVATLHGARVVIATSIERFGQGVRRTEDLARDAANTRRTDVRIVRVGTAYGPRMPLDDGHVVPRLLVQALRGEDLVVAP